MKTKHYANTHLFQNLKNIPLLLLLSAVISAVTSDQAMAAKRQKKLAKFPETTITELNYSEALQTATPGKSFSIEANITSAREWPEQGRYLLPIALYLVKEDYIPEITQENLPSLGLYFGSASIRSPRAGTSTHTLKFTVPEELIGHEDRYRLVAWTDPANEKLTISRNPIFVSQLNVSLSDQEFGKRAIEISAFEPDSLNLVVSQGTDNFVEGVLTLRAVFADSEWAELSFCGVTSDAQCLPLEAWDPKTQIFSQHYSLSPLPKDEPVSTLFRVRLPRDIDLKSLKVEVRDNSTDNPNYLTSAEKKLSLYSAPTTTFYSDTDFARDLQISVNAARKMIRKARLAGKLPDPTLNIKRSLRQGQPIDLTKALKEITSSAEISIKSTSITQADSSTLPSGLKTTLPGSRFNMPDGDFPWLKNIGVKADPPPERYTGKGYPSLAEFKRCIPFFCGPNSVDEAGKEPSQSCIRQYCGSTLEDIQFGGRNNNLVDEQTGFDKNFTAGGFGARVGISGQAKVYSDKAISDYVAASYATSAYFGVKVFDYSVPIFEASSQAVYSPTEIVGSQARNEIKILGRVIQRENKPSSGLSIIISKTYGLKKNADVGLGPINVDIEVEAGGTGELRLAIDQIDILRGIIGSVTPSAKIGASAKALTDITIGRFGIQGELTLIEDQVPLTANFNVGLDVAAKAVRPQLVFTIKNVLIGPNGRIKLLLEVGIPPLTVGYSTTLVSFSTGTFETTIYDKTKSFGTINY